MENEFSKEIELIFNFLGMVGVKLNSKNEGTIKMVLETQFKKVSKESEVRGEERAVDIFNKGLESKKEVEE
jgi:hypothetical protein